MKRLMVSSLSILIFALLTACGSSTPQTTTEPATALPTESQPTQQPPAIPTDTAMPQETETAIPATEAPVSSISYLNDIAPILNQSCFNCHGGDFTREGLDVSTYELLMKGSFDGAVIIPSDAAGSKLVNLITSGKMPKRGTKLTPEQVRLIADWINAGAPNN